MPAIATRGMVHFGLPGHEASGMRRTIGGLAGHVDEAAGAITFANPA